MLVSQSPTPLKLKTPTSRPHPRGTPHLPDRFHTRRSRDYFGVLPAVFGPTIIPIALPSSSSLYISFILALYCALLARVSWPCTVLAAAQRFRPSGVFGPVDSPPWVLQTFLPRMAGARHCCLVRFDWAWHCLHRIRPPSVRNVFIFTALGGCQHLILHRTSW